MGTMRRPIGFLRWRADLPSGGNRYDDELAAGLTALGADVREHPITGPWPLPDPDDQLHLTHLLTREDDWLIGNIVASGAPDTIRDATRSGRRIHLLLHYFPADDPGLSPDARRRLDEQERAAVGAATTVITTSRWAAEQVATRYGREDAVVALPGTDKAERSAGRGEPPSLLWLGRVTSTKDPLTLIEALQEVVGLGWTARLVGPDTVEPALTATLRARLDAAGLSERVEVTGPRTGEDLEAVWRETDLLVHTSRAETYGMVVAEALARGIPSVVATGTGAVEAQRVGATFPPGDTNALAETLREWLTDDDLRESWRRDAAAQRDALPTWADTATTVLSALR